MILIFKDGTHRQLHNVPDAAALVAFQRGPSADGRSVIEGTATVVTLRHGRYCSRGRGLLARLAVDWTPDEWRTRDAVIAGIVMDAAERLLLCESCCAAPAEERR